MITSKGWLSWAIQKPSGYNKLWSDRNGLQGYIPHSAVGSADDVITQQSNDSIPKSVHGVIRYSGEVTQFLPVLTSPWASGSHTANRLFVAFENEGGTLATGYGEPLTEAQVQANVHILEDLAVFKGVYNDYWHRPVSTQDLRATLYEHNECIRFGSSATECPSGRIPWGTILERLTPLKDGLVNEPDGFKYLYNNGVPIRRWGSITSPSNKGREAWNFGGAWWWVRHFDPKPDSDDMVFNPIGYLSLEEGD